MTARRRLLLVALATGTVFALAIRPVWCAPLLTVMFVAAFWKATDGARDGYPADRRRP